MTTNHSTYRLNHRFNTTIYVIWTEQIRNLAPNTHSLVDWHWLDFIHLWTPCVKLSHDQEGPGLLNLVENCLSTARVHADRRSRDLFCCSADASRRTHAMKTGFRRLLQATFLHLLFFFSPSFLSLAPPPLLLLLSQSRWYVYVANNTASLSSRHSSSTITRTISTWPRSIDRLNVVYVLLERILLVRHALIVQKWRGYDLYLIKSKHNNSSIHAYIYREELYCIWIDICIANTYTN